MSFDTPPSAYVYEVPETYDTGMNAQAVAANNEEIAGQESSFNKVKRMWQFFYVNSVNEFASCLRHAWYRVVYWINPHKNGLNPIIVQKAHRVNQTAKVVLLLHALGTHPSSFIPMAKRLSDANVHDIYTVTFRQTRDNPVQIETLKKRIKEITQKYLERGYKNVDFLIIGHSLGALVGSKYIWRGEHCVDHATVSALISIAGRLKYVSSPFSWYFADVKPDIEETFKAYQKNPDKVALYTIWSDRDAIVPKESVHIQGEAGKEKTVEGWGHLGVVFAPDALSQVVDWVKRWQFTEEAVNSNKHHICESSRKCSSVTEGYKRFIILTILTGLTQ